MRRQTMPSFLQIIACHLFERQTIIFTNDDLLLGWTIVDNYQWKLESANEDEKYRLQQDNHYVSASMS